VRWLKTEQWRLPSRIGDHVFLKSAKLVAATLGAAALVAGAVTLGIVVGAGATEPASGDIVPGSAVPIGAVAHAPFASGQLINVVIPANSAFAAPDNTANINIVECSAPAGVPPTNPIACDGNTIQGSTIIPNADGSFTSDNYQVFALPDSFTLGEGSSGPICGNTAGTECILYIGNNQNDFTKPHLWSQPFFVAPNATDTGSPPGDGSAPPTASAPDPTLSTVVASPTTATADGVDLSTVTVTLIGSTTSGPVPVSGKTVTLTSLSSTAKISGPSPLTTDATGKTTFTVTDTVVEPVTLTAVDTSDTPNVTVTQTASVTFQTPAVDASHSTVSANPTTVTAGGSTTITVTLRDQGSTPQPVAGQTVTLAGTGSAVITPAATPNVTNASGVVTFTATDAAAEVVTFTATDTTTSPATVISNTASVTFGTLNVSASQSTVTAVTPAPIGSSGTTVVVTLLSSTSSPVAGKVVSLRSSSGTAVIGASYPATTGSNGQVSFSLTDTVREPVTVTATDTTDGITLTSMPTVVFATGSASATASTMTASATTSPANGETQTLITVTVTDQFGDPEPGKTVTLQDAPSGNVQTHPISVGSSTPGVTNASGIAEFEVDDTHAETVTFIATDTTDSLVLSKTVSITYTPGPADPTALGSTVTASPANPPADGSTPSTITVTLTDYFSNPIAGKTISLNALNGNSTITVVHAVTNAAGQATFTVTDSTAQVVTYQAMDVTDGNAVLAAEAAVNFGNPVTTSSPISGTGSSYAAPAIETWAHAVSGAPYNLSVQYAVSNSGTGRYEFTNQTVDFAVSDIGYVGNTDTTPPSFPFNFIPITAGGIAFMYHVPGLTTQLQLSNYTACGLLTGGIKNWDDPSIAADNPGVSLPNLPVIPVTESDSAGTNYVLEEYCIDEQPALWAAFVQAQESQSGGPTDGVAISPTSPNSNWPGIRGGLDDQTTTAVASDVANNNGAIGAVQVKYAQDSGFDGSDPTKNVALVKNASGDYTPPTPVDVASALAYATQLPNGTHQLNFNGIGPHVYNPSTYSYLLTPTTGWSPSKGNTMSQFVNYALTLGQQSAPSFGYPSLGLSLEQYGINEVQKYVPGAVPLTAAEQQAYACGDLTPSEVAAGQTTPTCSSQPGSFGSGGKVTTDFYGQADGINAMAALPHGDTLAAGFALNPAIGEEAALAEYTSVGTLDSTFGTAGKVDIDFNLGGNSAVTAVYVDQNGSIMIGGYAYNPTLRVQQSFVARLTSNGTLDQTFGSGGVYLTQSTPACSSSEVAAFSEFLGGDVAALVTCYDVSAGGTSGSSEILGVAPNGKLDPLFGSNGVTALNLPPDPVAGPFGQEMGFLNTPVGFMAETSQGVYVAAESQVNGQSGIGIERVQSNGQVDQSFGTDGQSIILPSDFGCTTPQNSSTCFGMYRPQSITTQQMSDGSQEVLIGGQDNETNQAAVLRLLPDGIIDTGFGTNGLADAGFSGPASAITTQNDGGVLVGGTDDPAGAGADLMAVARLSSGGQLDTSFGNQGYTEVRFGSYGAQLTSLVVDSSGDYIAAGATLTGTSGPLTVDFALTELDGSSVPPVALSEATDVLALPIIVMAVIGMFVIARRRKSTHSGTASAGLPPS